MVHARRIFVTGTDTDVGKTLVTNQLLKFFQNKQQSVVAIKPVAAGCCYIDGQLKNEDAIKLIDTMKSSKTCHINYEYSTINPIALKPAIAPHIAAEESNTPLSVNLLHRVCNLSQFNQSTLLIEGVGGWLVPLNDYQTMADWVEKEKLSVVLVVAMKLGCLNHTLLTVDNILSRDLVILGWVANCIDPKMDRLEENIAFLKKRISAPMISKIPFLKTKEALQQSADYFCDATLEVVHG